MSPPDELVDAVRRATRRSCFDFDAAALEVRREASELFKSKQAGGESHVWAERGMNLTADECREIFSSDFKAKVVTPDATQLLPQPESRATVSLSSDKISYDDIIRVQEELEGAARQNYERVFQRVYQSLGLHEQREESQGSFRLPPTNEVLMAMERRTAEKQQKEREAIIAQQERLEAERLRAERDRLRRRFDADSEDAQGEDPLRALASLPRDIVDAIEEDPVFDRIRAVVSPHSNYEEEAPLSNMRTLTSFFDSPEFEAVLVEVERELEISADDKIGKISTHVFVILSVDMCFMTYIGSIVTDICVGSGSCEDGESELAEVLRILESTPRVAAGAAIADDGDDLLLKLWPQPQKTNKSNSALHGAVDVAKPSPSASQALPPPPPQAAAATVSGAKAARGGPVVPGPRGGRMFDSSAAQASREGEAEGSEGEGSGDDSGLDEDWSKRRSAMKSARQGGVNAPPSDQAPPPLPAVWSSGEVPSLRTRRAKKRSEADPLAKRTSQVISRETEDSSQESDADADVVSSTDKSISAKPEEGGGIKDESKEAEVVAKVVINENEVVADRGGIFGSLGKGKSSEPPASTGSLRGTAGLRPGGPGARMQGRFASSISAAKAQGNVGVQS
jgi:hypothetical protein